MSLPLDPEEADLVSHALPGKRRGFPWSLLVKAAITAGLAYFVVTKVDLQVVGDHLGDLDAVWLAIAVLATLALYGFSCVRWHFILRGIEAPLKLRQVTAFFAIGLFFNQALPSSIGGDALRIWRVFGAGQRLSKAVSSVLLDRSLGFASLFTVAAFGLPTSFVLLAGQPLRWALPLFILGMVVALTLMLLFDRLVPRRLAGKKPWRWFIDLARDGRAVLLHPGLFVVTAVVGLAGSLASVFAAYALARALGLPLDFSAAIFTVPLLLTLIAVPVSLAGWGLREGLAIFLFGLVGVSHDGALALSILMGLLGVVLSLPGGLVWLLTRERDKT